MTTLKPLGAYSSTAERDEMPARLRRISSHQITHERAAKVIEDMARELEALAPDRTVATQDVADSEAGMPDLNKPAAAPTLGQFDQTAINTKEEALRLELKYNELIMAVAQKWPNETRHQTALRYIQERERSRNDTGATTEQLVANRVGLRGITQADTSAIMGVGLRGPHIG